MNLREYVAIELKKLRVESKENQSQLAESISINKDTVVRYENGSCSMKIDILEKILNHYGVSLYIFFKDYNA